MLSYFSPSVNSPPYQNMKGEKDGHCPLWGKHIRNVVISLIDEFHNSTKESVKFK